MTNVEELKGLLERATRFVKRLFKKQSTQRTFCYCKNCRNELCGDLGAQCFDAGSEVHYICSQCGWQTDFLFDAPVPIYLRAFPPDEQWQQ